jgi:hypothetical protein
MDDDVYHGQSSQIVLATAAPIAVGTIDYRPSNLLFAYPVPANYAVLRG